MICLCTTLVRPLEKREPQIETQAEVDPRKDQSHPGELRGFRPRNRFFQGLGAKVLKPVPGLGDAGFYGSHGFL